MAFAPPPPPPPERDRFTRAGFAPYGGLADLSTPALERVEALDLTTVRVTFNTPMQVDGSLLDPSNYDLATVEATDADPPVVQLVTAVGASARYVDLTVSGLLPYRRYRATVG